MQKVNNGSILIATTPNDLHAASVMLALRELGHKCDIWFTGDIPEKSYGSILFDDNNSHECYIQHLSGEDSISSYNTFWFRRLSQPQLSPEKLVPPDHAFAYNESKEHIKSILNYCSMNLICVNGYEFAMRAEIKSYQLRAARSVGLKFPRTLISNNPCRIKKFISDNKDLGAIYKSHHTPIWVSDGRTSFGYTALVNTSDLPSDATLRLTPGIFQEHVDKKYELRIICMGDDIFPVRIFSQEISGAEIDWRIAQDRRMRLEKTDLPVEIETKCRKLIKNMGLRFGCIDMIVSRNGEYIFLEVNQMGQFLWIEEIDPTINIFDRFVSYIQNPDAPTENYKNFGLSYLEFREEARNFLTAAQTNRQDQLESNFVYRE